MKPMTLICLIFFLIGVAIWLIQLWTDFWSYDMFIKLILTDGTLFVVCFVIAFLIRENKLSDSIHKGNSLE